MCLTFHENMTTDGFLAPGNSCQLSFLPVLIILQCCSLLRLFRAKTTGHNQGLKYSQHK